MLDLEPLIADLESLGPGQWRNQLQPRLAENLGDRAHGKLREWRQILDELPKPQPGVLELHGPAVYAPCPEKLPEQTRKLLLALAPWRKGPFRIGSIRIDAEWQSNLKWDRISGAIESLEGRSVLDVGCGNGYYALRMHGMGARMVIGIDPTVLFVVQHLAVRRFMPALPVHVLPLRLHEFPQSTAAFDTCFSMGVLYHQRDPSQHLDQLHGSLRTGGQLVLETLILPGQEMEARTPTDRYARMRNVWLLPTIPQLEDWVGRAGFDDIQMVDVSRTSTNEQRTTEWMPFESLAEALDPLDPSLTIEGWPAPRRAVLLCRRK
ncbi:MAG: tRNA 5-methoxyuridine(34)/uridine 5-oxyacetic acid(34) synthase CmoB [Gammaproteobacteria bacterium]